MNRDNNHKALDALINENIESDVPPEVEAKMRQRLDAFRVKMAEAEATAPAGGRSFYLLQNWRRALAVALPVAAAILLAAVIWSTFGGGNGSHAYAEVVEKMRKAQTMTYTLVMPDAGVLTNAEVKCTYKAPSSFRQVMEGGKVVGVYDFDQSKGIVSIPEKREYFEINFERMPEQWRPAKAIEDLTTLPERASEELGVRTVDGRKVKGYRVTEDNQDLTVWVDPATGDLIRVEGKFKYFPTALLVIKNVQIDPDLDDSLFAMTPPAGFEQAMAPMELGQASEQDLVFVLRWWSAHHKSGEFPALLDVASFASAMKRAKDAGELQMEGINTREQRIAFSKRLSQGVIFLAMLRAENDWHYAGKGVKPGDPTTPIAWWKPSDSETYRVIYADFSIGDVAADDLPKTE